MTYNPDSLNENRLLYSLAKYNFTSYLVRNFDIEIENFSDMHRLAVSGFRNFGEALVYARELYRNTSIMTIAKGSRNVVISRTNLPLLGAQFSYNDYDKFYSEHFAPLPRPSIAVLEEQTVSPEQYDPELTPDSGKKDDGEGEETPAATGEDDGIIVPEDVPTENESTEIVTDTVTETPATEETPNNDNSIIVPVEQPSQESGQPQEIPDSPSTEIKDDDTVREDSAGNEGVVATQPKENAAKTESPVNAVMEKVQQQNSGNTVRMDINSDILEIIDEDAVKNDAPSNSGNVSKEPVEDDDEYFDFDGF